ncbi:MAG: VOC family protein [Lachnospiraceae bacterium]
MIAQGLDMKMHHIGIATDDILKMQLYLQQITTVVEIGETVYDEKQDASLSMVTLGDGTKIELIAGKVVEKIVKKRNFLYHICYEVADIEKKIEQLVEYGAMLISESKEAILFGGRRVAFLMTPMGMIELLEQGA